jgi:protein SCO1
MRGDGWAAAAVRGALAAVSTMTGAAILCAILWPTPLTADASRWHGNYFPNVPLITQNGDTVHFYDLIKDKIVAIDLIYTTCEFNCPLETGRLAQVQQLLADRMGRDVLFLSISIDPKHDTPAVLKTYADEFRAGPGWLFLTGRPEDIELLSKKIGLYSPPNPDNPDGHTPMVLVGNEATGEWVKDSALDNPKYLAQMIGNWMNKWKTSPAPRSYTEAPAIVAADRGRYLFTSQCATCHTIGRGDNVGPDLAGITAVRDRTWLAHYISAPETMRSQGDAVAAALAVRYPAVRMPNLGLTETEAADVLAYVDAQGRSSSGAAESGPGPVKGLPKSKSR